MKKSRKFKIQSLFDSNNFEALLSSFFFPLFFLFLSLFFFSCFLIFFELFFNFFLSFLEDYFLFSFVFICFYFFTHSQVEQGYQGLH